MLFLSLYILCFPPLSFAYALIGLIKSPLKWKKYIPFLVYALFIGAYVFEPPPRNYINDLDLAVYLPMIEDFGKLSLIEAFQKYNDGLYARDFIFWFFGTIQAPHMIPAITTSTVYAVAFYITCDTAARYNSERYIPIIVLFQISMLPYFTIVNNVRNVFSLALVVLAVYLDLVRKKSFLFVFFCYIFGCLMHLSTAVLIVFRVFCLPLKNCFELVFVLPVIFKPLVDIIYSTNIFSFLGGELGNRVHQILSRLHQYMNNDFAAYSIISVNSITVKFDRTVMVIGMTIALVLISYGLRSVKRIFNDNEKFYVFIGLIAIMSILLGITMPMPNFWRFAAAFYTAFGMLIIPFILHYKELPALLRLLVPVYAVIGFLSFIMQIWKCTWFDFGNWMLSFFTANMFTVLYDLINGMLEL